MPGQRARGAAGGPSRSVRAGSDQWGLGRRRGPGDKS